MVSLLVREGGPSPGSLPNTASPPSAGVLLVEGAGSARLRGDAVGWREHAPCATGCSPEDPAEMRFLGMGKILSLKCTDYGSLGLLDIWLDAT